MLWEKQLNQRQTHNIHVSQGEYNASWTEKLKNLEIGNITEMKKRKQDKQIGSKAGDKQAR